MTDLFLAVLNLSLSASVVILAVLAARLALRQAPKKWSYLLWSVVGFRLCCPVSLEAVFSIFRAAPVRPAVSQVAPVMGQAPASSLQYLPALRAGVGTGVAAPAPAVSGGPVLPTLPTETAPAAADPLEVALLAGAMLWVVGMAVIFLAALISYLDLHRSLSTATRREGSVYEADGIRSPFILGLFRPRIYLPYGLDEATLGYVLDHERCHLRRGDPLWRVLAYLLLCVHWFNPLVWLAFRLMGKDMEMSCDERVLGRGGNIRRAYSTTLLSFASERRFPTAAPLAFGETAVKTRIRNALNWKKPKTWVTLLSALLCLILVVSCAVNPVAETPSADPTESTAPSPEASLPTLEEAGTMAREALTARLSGHTQTELWEAWGEPQSMFSGMHGDIWALEALRIGVYYDRDTDQVTDAVLWTGLPSYEAMMALIPEQYADLLEVEYLPEEFAVYEKQSREEFRADFAKDPWPDYENADAVGEGWLGSIVQVDQETARRVLEVDTGGRVFATDGAGVFYAFYFPTDVRIHRSGGISEEDFSRWDQLNKWAWTLPDAFLAAHPSLTALTDEEARQMVGNGTAYDMTLEELLATITAEDIGAVSCFGPNEPPAPEVLAPILNEAAKHTVEHDVLTLNGSDTDIVWSMEFFVAAKDQGGYSDNDAVHLFAGLEENVVEISAGKNLPGGRVFVRDAALYELLRTLYDTPSSVDEAAYEKYRTAVDAAYDKRLADYQETWPQISGWELTCFQSVGERSDLGIAAYQMDAALTATPRESIIHTGAGGAYVDSMLRLRGIDWRLCYLAIVDGKSAGVFYRSDEPLDLSAIATRQAFLDMIENNRQAGG